MTDKLLRIHLHQLSPAVFKEPFQDRQEVLKQIEVQEIVLGPHGNECRAQELRHLLRDRNYQGEFLPMVCDYCYIDMWQSKEDKTPSCPGCGWMP